VYLAKGLKLNITDLLLFLSVIGVADPFADLQTTVDAIRHLEYIRASGITLREMDYILNYNPDSPSGLRNETLIQMIESLRKKLSDNKETIDKLKLSEADKNNIINFNADALPAMADAALLAAILPLQNILNPVSNNFKDAGFSVEESAFIIQYNLASINADSKVRLVDNIKTLEQNLTNFLNIKSLVASAFSLT